MAKKRKKKRKTKPFLNFLILVSVSIFMIGTYELSNSMIMLKNIRDEKTSLLNEIEDLKADEEKLKMEVLKLNDPDYVARYAREKYLYSKDKEILIRID